MSQADDNPTSRFTPNTSDRVTLRVDHDLLAEVDQLVEDGKFDSRSEAFRAGAELLTGGDLS